jgi:tetratricopeptide (TPR) repeat protein
VYQLKYWAFLSYSHGDAKWADWLHKSLESFRVPKLLVGTSTAVGPVPERLVPVFRDREELPTATDLHAVIIDALQRSRCQIVICSPLAAKSKWVNEEILAFKRLGREDRIYCLIVDGEPNAADIPGREGEECFPPALRFRLGSDGALSQMRTSPIPADVRPGRDNQRSACLRLIAGMLGLGYDALRQREHQRHNRRLLAVTCASLAGMLIASGLAAYALIQRSAAQRQTARAEAETARAEAEAETANQATSFLVGLFRTFDPSEARGNNVTAREILDKGTARIDAELAKQPAIQATLIDTIGTVYMALGLYNRARPLLERAVATRRTLAGADQLALSDSLSHLGDLLASQAEFEAAEKAYREAIQIQSATANDSRSQVKLAIALYGLGTLLFQQGKYAEADRTLRQTLEWQHKLYGVAHGDIARTLKDLARIINAEGDLHAAIPMMRSAVAMQRQLRGAEPHPDLADALNDLGLLLEEDTDYDESEKMFVESLAMYRRLFGDKHPDIANGLNNLAGVLQDKRNLAKSESTYRQAVAMQRELVGEVNPDVANILNNIAFVQYDRGNAKGALATERESLVVYRKLFPNDNPNVAAVTNRIGFWLTLAGEYAEAERLLQEGLAMRRRLFGGNHPNVASSLENLAILQVATRHYSDALISARTAADIYTSALSASHWKTAIAESAEGAALAGLGNYPEAERLLVHSYGILSNDVFVPAAFRSLTQHYLQELHRRRERADSAE